jgi:hypothetical protein
VAEPTPETEAALVWDCGPHTNAWKGHDARCRQVPRTEPEPTPETEAVDHQPGDVADLTHTDGSVRRAMLCTDGRWHCYDDPYGLGHTPEESVIAPLAVGGSDA